VNALLINERDVDRLIERLNIKVTDETTSQEMLEIVRKLVVAAINAIDKDEIYKIVSQKIERELRARGIR